LCSPPNMNDALNVIAVEVTVNEIILEGGGSPQLFVILY
jgi:hypothetical protein